LQLVLLAPIRSLFAGRSPPQTQFQDLARNFPRVFFPRTLFRTFPCRYAQSFALPASDRRIPAFSLLVARSNPNSRTVVIPCTLSPSKRQIISPTRDLVIIFFSLIPSPPLSSTQAMSHIPFCPGPFPWRVLYLSLPPLCR